MLKIKNNVDLKELEKFGFKYDKKLKEWNYGDLFNGYVYVEEENKIIKPIYDENMWICMEDLFYDLIKADLVEKVDD